LGWTPPSGREVMTLEEMVAEFALENLHKSGAVFDIDKLTWFNRQYLIAMDEKDFNDESLRRLESAAKTKGLPWYENVAHALLPLLRERLQIWSDIDTLTQEGEFDFFFADPTPARAEIPQKNSSPEEAARHLTEITRLLQDAPESVFMTPDSIKEIVWPYAESVGRGVALWPLRFSLSGKAKSPDPFLIASIIGKETTLRRMKKAVEIVQAKE